VKPPIEVPLRGRLVSLRRQPIVTPRKLSKAKHSGPRGADGVARLAAFVGAPGAESNSMKLFVAVEKHARQGELATKESVRLASLTCPECNGKLDVSGTCPDCGWAPKKVLARPRRSVTVNTCEPQQCRPKTR
jgi:hypothetical protein